MECAEKVGEKVCVIPRHKVDNHKLGIDYDVTVKLEKIGIKVKTMRVQRMGGTSKGDFARCDVDIEPFSVKQKEKLDFGIVNCCVIPFT